MRIESGSCARDNCCLPPAFGATYYMQAEAVAYREFCWPHGARVKTAQMGRRDVVDVRPLATDKKGVPDA